MTEEKKTNSAIFMNENEEANTSGFCWPSAGAWPNEATSEKWNWTILFGTLAQHPMSLEQYVTPLGEFCSEIIDHRCTIGRLESEMTKETAGKRVKNSFTSWKLVSQPKNENWRLNRFDRDQNVPLLIKQLNTESGKLITPEHFLSSSSNNTNLKVYNDKKKKYVL